MRPPEPANLPPSSTRRKAARRQRPNDGLHYLTFSCYQRLPLLGTARLRDEFMAALRLARERHRFKLVAWVAMPEHIHIILVPTARQGLRGPNSPGSALPSILLALKKPFAERVLARWKELRWKGLASLADARGHSHFWQAGGGFDRNVRDAAELAREVRYIHQNPVARGLVKQATDWRWSSAGWYAGVPSPGPAVDTINFDGSPFPGPHPERYLGEAR